MSVLKMRYVLLSTWTLFLGGCDTETMVPVPSGSGGGNGTDTAQITSLQVTPSESRIPAGLQQQLIAQVTLSDGSTAEATADVTVNWSSSDEAVATVSNTIGSKGVATAVGAGATTVSASGMLNGQNFSATADLTVTP